LFRWDPFHPSLNLKQTREVWTVRIGRSHRVIGYREGSIFYWGAEEEDSAYVTLA
jgi:hypothetical protein